MRYLQMVLIVLLFTLSPDELDTITAIATGFIR